MRGTIAALEHGSRFGELRGSQRSPAAEGFAAALLRTEGGDDPLAGEAALDVRREPDEEQSIPFVEFEES